jgi:hypothetical protein
MHEFLHEQKDRARRGPPPVEKRDPAIINALEKLLADEVAGDPMNELKWVRISLRQLEKALNERGHKICYYTVGRLLKDMGYSQKANKRKQAGSQHPDRNKQFEYIASQKRLFITERWPVISVDTKKKELIGNFRRPGRSWCKDAPEVDEHGFASAAEGVAVPFGVYDVARNHGFVAVGLSHNTPEFAVSNIAFWWKTVGRVVYPDAGHILILADGGGANGSRCKAWKLNLQKNLCNPFSLTVTVCHYPPDCSKWNPVEHRLFSEISKNWDGKPLRTIGIMLGYIRGTTTNAGLKVEAVLDEGIYRKGQKITREAMDQINIRAHGPCPAWNYTIGPE